MIRRSRPGDEAGLISLWQTAFGDDITYIKAFFKRLYQPGGAIVWAEGNVIASAIYLLDAGFTSLPDGQPLPTAYSYALATLPGFRGQGLAAQVTKAAIALSFDDGFECNVICPAEESLFPYYEKLGYSRGFDINEEIIQFDTNCNQIVSPRVMSTGFSEYYNLRSDAIPLFSTQFSNGYLSHVQASCQSAGGDLYLLSIEGEIGLAAAECQGTHLQIKEILLPKPLLAQGVQALMTHLGAKTAICRTPKGLAQSGSDTIRPFALIAFPHGKAISNFSGYFPFVLD